MNMKNKIAALTILTAFNFANIGQAASVDSELAIIAAEQPDDETETPASSQNTVPEKKSRSELKAEQKRLKAEQKAAEKKQKEEMKAAEKEVREAQKKSKSEDYQKLKNPRQNSGKGNFPTIDPVTTPVEAVPMEKPQPSEEVTTFEPPVTSAPPTTQTPPTTSAPTTPQTSPTTPVPAQTPATTQTPAQNSTQVESPAVSLPNPIVMQSNFDDLAKALNFVPLYMPKKSGFTINSMMIIGGRTAEIRYGRRWEPEVSLNIRTYKRMDGEETKDISGVSGVKWRVDMTSGTTVYIAKIAENKHVAAWAVGSYTFSAQADNLSFAAFHAIVADELVDLSQHYYVN